jgi:hypothetical protein
MADAVSGRESQGIFDRFWFGEKSLKFEVLQAADAGVEEFVARAPPGVGRVRL